MNVIENTGWQNQNLDFDSWRVVEQGFGSNVWNVNVYDGNDYNLGSGLQFNGYYTESALSYDTRTRWTSGSSGTPASASGYRGCDHWSGYAYGGI